MNVIRFFQKCHYKMDGKIWVHTQLRWQHCRIWLLYMQHWEVYNTTAVNTPKSPPQYMQCLVLSTMAFFQAATSIRVFFPMSFRHQKFGHLNVKSFVIFVVQNSVILTLKERSSEYKKWWVYWSATSPTPTRWCCNCRHIDNWWHQMNVLLTCCGC